MKKLLTIILFLSLLCCLGCSYLGDYLEIAEGDTISDEYLSALNRWTRQKTVYSEFETRARIVATYKNREFIDAFRDEYSRIYHLPQGDERIGKDVFGHDGKGFEEFLFYASIPDGDSNDFARKGSIWDTFLLSENDERFYPDEIREVTAINPIITKFFPYVNPYYGKFYSVKFSCPEKGIGESRRLKLVFASVLGRVELKWGY
ncbi:MAG: hypothetical protein U9R24_05890 [Thermodesulfobacteriota bacterium]|nr:hypothetical protein [Thermodesulfobacteriota bacterium]